MLVHVRGRRSYPPPIMSKREDTTPDIQAAVQEHLLPAVSDLKDIQKRLRSLLESLPAVPDQGEEEMDDVTELRSVLGCVLLDSMGPAVRDLEAVAAYVVKSAKPDER